jgi:hypothetical protein
MPGGYMKKIAVLIFYVALMSAVSCSQKVDSKTPLLENAVKMSEEKDAAKIAFFYTEGTVKAAEAFARKTGGTDILSGLDRKLFVKGAKWDLKNETKDGNSALVVITITAHPSRNMIGYEASVRLRFEDGSWKLDREDYIRSLITSL